MKRPTVDRFRYPWRVIVPGEPHTVIVIWPDSVEGNTYEVVMYDAATLNDAIAGVEYLPDYDDAAAGKVVFVADIPIDLDTAKLYELRVRELTPALETLVAGYVTFAPTVVGAM